MLSKFFKAIFCSFPLLGLAGAAFAQQGGVPVPNFNLQIGQAGSPEQVLTSLQIIALLTVLTLAPAFLVMTTSFVRFIIVFSFLRSALGTQQSPPNQILLGLSLFLTFFVMAPVWDEVNQKALQPYFGNRISQTVAMDRAVEPVKAFMAKFTREKDLALFIRLAKIRRPNSIEDVPVWVMIPAFVLSELKTAFFIGFMIYIPFLIIDMVVSAILMAMGMMMLPPVLISLPFKLMLFVLVDGWYLIVGSMVESLV